MTRHLYDLGGGHEFEWHYSGPQLVGIVEYHNTIGREGVRCGQLIVWVEGFGLPRTHMQLGGGPGDEQALSVSPRIQCEQCGATGYIRNGAWIAE